MMRIVRIALLVACVGCDVAAEREATPPAKSERATNATSCDSATTTVALRDCAAADLAHAEQMLAATLDSLRARGASAVLLDSAQVAWTQSRRHDCVLAGAAYAGGSLEGVEVATCMTQHTQRRATQLSQLFRTP